MPRPSKCRRVCREPLYEKFDVTDTEHRSESSIRMSVEEYETLRLMDYMGMNQEKCASQMQVSRATVQALYTEARKKIARFLVEGIRLEISGGNYELCRETDCYARRVSVDQAENNENHIHTQYEKKGDFQMKIAVTYEDGQVFQHFGHTEKFKVYNVEDGKIVSTEVVDTNGQGHGALTGFLFGGGVDVLICGGIGGGARNALAEAGIELYPGAVGAADEQVESFLAGKLVYDPNTTCNHHHDGDGCGENKGGCGGNHCS